MPSLHHALLVSELYPVLPAPLVLLCNVLEACLLLDGMNGAVREVVAGPEELVPKWLVPKLDELEDVLS